MKANGFRAKRRDGENWLTLHSTCSTRESGKTARRVGMGTTRSKVNAVMRELSTPISDMGSAHSNLQGETHLKESTRGEDSTGRAPTCGPQERVMRVILWRAASTVKGSGSPSTGKSTSEDTLLIRKAARASTCGTTAASTRDSSSKIRSKFPISQAWFRNPEAPWRQRDQGLVGER